MSVQFQTKERNGPKTWKVLYQESDRLERSVKPHATELHTDIEQVYAKKLSELLMRKTVCQVSEQDGHANQGDVSK